MLHYSSKIAKIDMLSYIKIKIVKPFNLLAIIMVLHLLMYHFFQVNNQI